MFRHKTNPTDMEEKKPAETTAVNSDTAVSANKNSVADGAKAEPSLKELIEKNLKWSQIIYEQNRKINNKLLWTAIAEWLKVFLIVAPIVLAILFLGPMFKNLMSQYSDLLGGNTPNTSSQQDSVSNLLLKWSNLDPAKQEQLKALFK
jgi:hypothetical protein